MQRKGGDSMTIDAGWWLLVCGVAGLVLGAVCCSFADQGGGHCVDFPDVFLGCVVSIFVVLVCIIVGLVLWVAGAQMTVGGVRPP